ncbi:hypothetical protein K9L67_01860 [Candidatus Woesearchaeota archaeon]|nr:hypothetical protein [Candidatus Woesearchaeota archaeon]MCF7900950.1 hypothetical protein [Candidatus Woesearchaeota archaeon]MCF8013604.1 hypothetical protein [Candidatus Woesearchaeota archaeon]
MKFFEKIKSYIQKADQTITEVAQDFNLMLTGYQNLVTVAHTDTINTKQKLYDLGDMSIFEFVKKGPDELENIIQTSKIKAESTYNKAKDIFTNFVDKQKQKMNTKQDLDDIIRKETKTTTTINEKPTTNYQETKNNNKSKNQQQNQYEFKPSNNYTNNISTIIKNDTTNVTELAQILSGKYKKQDNKKAWSWKNRMNVFDQYTNKETYSKIDLQGLENLKKSIFNNKYLQRKHKNIASEINQKIDKIIQEYK